MNFLVECILKRDGGSRVDMGGGSVYHFHPKNDPAQAGRDIAVVSDKAHFQRFMQIPEGYQIPEDLSATAAPALTTPAPVNTILPDAAGPADVAPVTLPDPDGNPPSTETPAPAPTPEPVDPVTLQPPAAPDAAPALPDEEALRAMDIETLRAQAEVEIGRKPSPKAKTDLLVSQIMATREAKADAATTAG